MTKVQQDDSDVLVKSRWAFFGGLFKALHESSQELVQRAIQESVDRRTAEVRTQAGEAVLPACPKCGVIDRSHIRRNGVYKRQLMTSEGPVQIAVPRLRCRCGKSLPVPHDAFGPRQRFSFDFHLKLIELVGMRVAFRPAAMHFARRGVHVSPATLSRQLSRLRLPALGPLPVSPSEISVDGMYVHLWDKERGWKGETACVLVAVNHDPRLQERVLGMVFAPSESEDGYRSLADLLISRGMKPEEQLTVISDGAAVIPAAFRIAFPKAQFQRCQIHLVWDVREEAPARVRDAIQGSAWWVLRASSMVEARSRLAAFVKRWAVRAPKSVALFKRGFEDATLCLRTKVVQRTNGRAERFIRECRRHYRPREAFRDNASAVRRIAMWTPILNAPHTSHDWLANLWAAHLGSSERVTAFSGPIHT